MRVVRSTEAAADGVGEEVGAVLYDDSIGGVGRQAPEGLLDLRYGYLLEMLFEAK